jgi:hypothetical protein
MCTIDENKDDYSLQISRQRGTSKRLMTQVGLRRLMQEREGCEMPKVLKFKLILALENSLLTSLDHACIVYF